MSVLAGPAAPPRRRLTAAHRRRQLIDVALESFATSGYDATTMEEIATAAGVTKPLLYQHFASKRALYLELIDDVAARLIGSLAAAAGAEVSPRRQVEAGFAAYFQFSVGNPSAVRMLFDSPHDDELARGLRTIEVALADFVAPLIAAGIKADHRRTVAAAVVGLTEGVTRDWLRQAHRPRSGTAKEGDPAGEADRLARRVAEFAWGGLRGLSRNS